MTVEQGKSKALRWFTSSYSGTSGDNCVEVALASEAVHVRDSKDREGPRLTVRPEAWAEFVRFAAACEV